MVDQEVLPWETVSCAVSDGTQCALRFTNWLESYEDQGPFFFHDDGHWYHIEPPARVRVKPSHFRPLQDWEVPAAAGDSATATPPA